MSEEIEFADYLAQGGKLTSPENATARYRAELMKILAVFVDSELAGASGFADCINMAPSLKSKIFATKIVQEKLRSAGVILEILESFGANTQMYLTTHDWSSREARDVYVKERKAGTDMRLNIFHSPIESWADSVVMGYLMGAASTIQLESMGKMSYQPAADKFGELAANEAEHAKLAENALTELADAADSKSVLQASVDYWWPRVQDSFAKSDSTNHEKLVKLGLREGNVDALAADWKAKVQSVLEGAGLKLPA